MNRRDFLARFAYIPALAAGLAAMRHRIPPGKNEPIPYARPELWTGDYPWKREIDAYGLKEAVERRLKAVLNDTRGYLTIDAFRREFETEPWVHPTRFDTFGRWQGIRHKDV